MVIAINFSVFSSILVKAHIAYMRTIQAVKKRVFKEICSNFLFSAYFIISYPIISEKQSIKDIKNRWYTWSYLLIITSSITVF